MLFNLKPGHPGVYRLLVKVFPGFCQKQLPSSSMTANRRSHLPALCPSEAAEGQETGSTVQLLNSNVSLWLQKAALTQQQWECLKMTAFPLFEGTLLIIIISNFQLFSHVWMWIGPFWGLKVVLDCVSSVQPTPKCFETLWTFSRKV